MLGERKDLCAHRPNFSSVSIVPVCKTVSVFFRCLYSIVIESLFEETNRSISDQTEQISHIFNNQLARIRGLIEH